MSSFLEGSSGLLSADRQLIRTVRANPTMPATLLRLVWGERNRRGGILSAQTLRRRINETALRCRRRQDAQEAMTFSSSCGTMRRASATPTCDDRVLAADSKMYKTTSAISSGECHDRSTACSLLVGLYSVLNGLSLGL